MKKTRGIRLCLVACVLTLILVGCGTRDGKDDEMRQGSLSKEETTSKETATYIDQTDYSSYLKKIWVTDSWKSDEICPISLVITQIEDGSIEGYFSVKRNVSFYYFNHARWEDKIPEFYGTIYDETAECEYDYKDGKEGTLAISFCENDRIEVVVNGKEDQRYLLRPYNVSDEEFRGEISSFEVELDSWGTVTLFYVDPVRRDYAPQVFALNEKGDILYEFAPWGSYYADCDVSEILVEDMNGDSLKDVKIILDLSSVRAEYRYELPFYQTGNGLFSQGDVVTTKEDLEEPKVAFDSFGEMDYALFLKTNVGYGVTLDYFKYGIYGDFTETMRDGEDAYFLLNEKVLGNEMSLATHEEWAGYAGEHIVSVSPDLEWIITRRFEDPSLNPWEYQEKWYRNGEETAGLNGDTIQDMQHFIMQKSASSEYKAMPEQRLQEVESMMEEIYGMDFSENNDKWICFDEYGKLLAVRELKGEGNSIYNIHEENCIRIYDISGQKIEMLYELVLPETEVAWPVEISQIVGTAEEGWLLFSFGDTTYRMDYPSGNTEKIGEFMYGTTYSPDGRYRAYCTGYNDLFDSWEHMEIEEHPLYDEMRERWDAIDPGWYVEELETGNTVYIPIEIWISDINRPIYGGRCIWIEKDKLLQILGQ